MARFKFQLYGTFTRDIITEEVFASSLKEAMLKVSDKKYYRLEKVFELCKNGEVWIDISDRLK